ncbi:Uncharacterised protein [Mycobacteroides abscessus subsp. abscessus]|uniref:hypothetical protein n=1 Tax=Mycobacteroides abscessus TaxID=36809 RepID=UPI00092C1287|nr:hypothetical protein [Mycobacteroides abscessus]SIG30574.1 Uncharacterised protein [Mycobacteroides abscessus subsp. abscessus]SIH55985.1 Uncharacterised protein [Mycobacteroides abscessus subsp. abscessus]SKW04843.1 Uncharacterised protein [Mycobacteroides abscessus subsp. abscessus]
MSSSRAFRAEFGGWCDYGDDPIRPGDEVRYDDDTPRTHRLPKPSNPHRHTGHLPQLLVPARRRMRMTDSPKVIVQQLDSSILIDIYLDGFMTGAATCALNYSQDDAEADRVSETLVRAVKTDPAAMEEIRREVRERLLGIEGETRNLDVFHPDYKER